MHGRCTQTHLTLEWGRGGICSEPNQSKGTYDGDI